MVAFTDVIMSRVASCSQAMHNLAFYSRHVVEKVLWKTFFPVFF